MSTTKWKLKPLPEASTEVTVDEHADELLADSVCELRPGIGLCDACNLPKWPQQYDGYGSMICLDCNAKEAKERKKGKK